MKVFTASILASFLVAEVGGNSVPSAPSFNQQQSLRRTAIGDFDELNTLFENARIVLPDTYEVSERVGIANLDLTIWNMVCMDMSLGDIAVSHTQESDQAINVLINVLAFDLTCEMEYSYKYGILSGDGNLKIITDDSSAFSTLRFVSNDFKTQPPTGSSVNDCAADVEINNMDFENDLASEVLEIFQGLIRGVVEREVGQVACNEFGSIGTTLLGKIIDLVDEQLEPYLGQVGEEYTDPLYVESTLQLPSSLSALDLQDTDSGVSKLFRQALDGVDIFLGALVTDESQSTSSGLDLVANIFLRDYFLDEDRAFSLLASQLPLNSTVLFTGHDNLFETTMILNKVRLFGLDTMTLFNPFVAIGKLTLQNELTWSQLTVEIDVTVDITPSTLESAILQDPTSNGITEDMTFKFGVDNVNVLASLLFVLDEDRLGSIEIGSLLNTEDFIPCLLSVVHQVELVGLDVDPNIVNEHALDDFIAPGLDRVFTDSAAAAVAMYTGVLRESLPSIFQVSVRNFVNDYIIDKYMADYQNTACPDVPSATSEYIDFANFFGGEGEFGDVPPMLKDLLDAELLSSDDPSGELRINQALLAPMSEKQSGQEGMIRFSDYLFSIVAESVPQVGLDLVQFSGVDFHLNNVDSLVAPAMLLEPTDNKKHVLSNTVNVAAGPDSLLLGFRGLFATEGDPVLTMRNELQMSLNLTGSELMADIFAEMSSSSFLTFPLRDLTNIDCWLSTLAAPVLGDNGIPTMDAGLALQSLLLDIPSMDLSIVCSNCSSHGLEILPELFQALDAVDVINVVEGRLLQMTLELVQSDFAQAYLNKLILESSMRCPHSPEFVNASAQSNYLIPSYPALSYDSVESLAFLATIAAQAATVVIAESHAGYDLETTDPLSGQNELLEMPNVRLLDFSSLETSLGQWAGSAIDQLLDYLNTNIPTNDGETELRINRFLRASLLDETGAMEIEFNNLSFGGENTEMSLKGIRVLGLDSVELLDVFDVIAPQTLRNRMSFKSLGIQLSLSLVGTDESSSFSKSSQVISISLELTNIEMSLALLLAMDLDILGSLKLSSMLELEKVLPCLLSAARDAKFTELQVSVGGIESFTIEGFRSDELRNTAASNGDMILKRYGDKILSAMPGFFDLTVRTMANNWIGYMMNNSSSLICPTSQFELAGVSSFLDFRELLLSPSESVLLGGKGLAPYGDLFRQAFELLEDIVLKVDESTGLSAINDAIVGPLSLALFNSTGSIVFQDVVSSDTRLTVGALDTTLQLRARTARLDNVDTIGTPLELFEATKDANQLDNTLTLGVGERPLHFGVRFLVALTGDDELAFRNEMDVGIDLSSATVLLRTLTMVAESRFYDFPLRDILNLNCWLAMIPAPELNPQGLRIDVNDVTAALLDLAASVSSANVNISCIECTSPKMPKFATLISSPEVQDDVTAVVNEVLQYISQLAGGNYVQVQIDRVLHDAALKCPHSPLYDSTFESAVYDPIEAPDSDYALTYLILLGGFTLALIMIIAIIILAVRYIVRRRHKKWLGSLPPHQLRHLAQRQRKEQMLETSLNESSQSLFRSSQIPCVVRWGMPLVILGNIAFFLSGHLSLGATVNVEADIAGEKFKVEQFFEFSMARSTVDIWKAGGRELAIMILLFSGIWPYTKQFITLALWFTSPEQVSVSRRGSILLWLDWLAKWSMVDVFVLVISIVAFRVSIESPDVSFLPSEFYSIEMMVVPLWGLYSNMIAQLISQVSSHFIIFYHRRVVNCSQGAIQLQRQHGGEPEVYRHGDPKHDAPVLENHHLHSGETIVDAVQRPALHEHQFSRPHRGETERLVVRRGVSTLLFASVVCLTVLIVVGCSIPSFSLEMFGLVGVAVEFGQDFEQATSEHSVFSVIQLLYQEAKILRTAADYVGMLTLSVLMATTVLFVPIVQSIALMRQWFLPATRTQRARMAVLIEILQAWQYAEVYLLAVFVASWQLGPVSQYMINSYCENLEEMFGQAVYYGILSENDAQCFSVKSSIERGFFVLAGGAAILALFNTFVTKAVLQYFRDSDERRNKASYDSDASDSGLTSYSEEELPVDVGFSARIRPAPVLFTDTFRWLLRPDNSLPASSRALFADPSDHWDLPEAQAVAFDDEDDHGLLQATYVSEKDHFGKDSRSIEAKAVSSLAGRPRKMLPAAAAAKGRRNYDDAESAMVATAMDSLSTDSGSMTSGGWSHSVQQGHLKDDRTYATPPGERYMRSQPQQLSERSISATQSIALSVAKSVAPSTVNSGVRSKEEQADELSMEEKRTVEELLKDDFLDIGTDDSRSEYYEETVDGDFEEYTVKTMSEILEDDEYDTYSRDTRSHPIV